MIAASAGWTVPGHNWLRYPLLGSRLQNRVIYVPPTRDGTIVDHRESERLAGAMDFDAWLRRLRETKVDAFVAMHPNPPELPWVLARPDVFAPLARAESGDGAAWRVLPPEPGAS